MPFLCTHVYVVFCRPICVSEREHLCVLAVCGCAFLCMRVFISLCTFEWACACLRACMHDDDGPSFLFGFPLSLMCHAFLYTVCVGMRYQFAAAQRCERASHREGDLDCRAAETKDTNAQPANHPSCYRRANERKQVCPGTVCPLLHHHCVVSLPTVYLMWYARVVVVATACKARSRSW
jgi:hypothetical protein